MATKTYNDLVKGDYILYETDDGMFKEAIITAVNSETHVSIEFTKKGNLTGRRLSNISAEWCEKHPPETD